MITKLNLLVIGVLLVCGVAKASPQWEAKWVSHPTADTKSYAVLHFRNSFELRDLPAKLPIKISADVRYKLYINGKYVGQGPANNDLKHYVYDEHDLAQALQKGKNLLAVTVFSMADLNPVRYESAGAKLLVQADGEMGEKLNTGSGNWRVFQNQAYSPTVRGKDFEVLSYWAMGVGENIEAAKYPWGWENLPFDDSAWPQAHSLLQGESYGNEKAYGSADFSLQARTIPFMDESPEQRPVLRQTADPFSGSLAAAWQKQTALVIPAHTQTTLLLDQTYLTKGHSFFTFSGGKGAAVQVSYAETLFEDASNKQQGHRDAIAGKEFIGLTDEYVLDGGQDREFSNLLPRVWRYVQVKIKTGSEPLRWTNYRAQKFIYPFQETASFQSDLPLHQTIWNVGWRTARLCADETYMDCPYYEQLQYIGDTRLQALISLYVSGDDRLMKNAINQFANSFTDEGITQSRFPSKLVQYIPPFSLYWINMIHDYHMHRKDEAFTSQHLHKVASVLFWFENKLAEDMLLGPMPWWSYVDWVKTWTKSSPPGSQEGGSVMLTLQYVYALQDAIALFEHHQYDSLARHFTALKEEIQQAVLAKGYHAGNNLFADTPDHSSYSQHANIMAILTDTAPKAQQSALFKRIVSDTSLTQANIYYAFYLHRAAQKTGNGDYFINNLAAWESMLALGLTTFAEKVSDSRSDCHAWSATPNFEFMNLVCGIQPAAAHFDKILIAPNPGALRQISGKMSHPKGEIAVDFTFRKNTVSGEVTIPEGTPATLRWNGKDLPLKPGKNKVKL